MNINLNMKIQKYISEHAVIHYIFLVLEHIYSKIFVLKIVQAKLQQIIYLVNVNAIILHIIQIQKGIIINAY